jgi:hypothetical protein
MELSRSPNMRSHLRIVTVSAALAAAAFSVSPAAAQSPQSYPYCALDTSIGATSCYYSSRAQCGSRCIENPSYQGPAGAMASARRGHRVSPRH